jgi:hypothetical protein
MPIVSAVDYPLQDWDPSLCPYCARHIPLFAVQ